jgi:hypothetical protein
MSGSDSQVALLWKVGRLLSSSILAAAFVLLGAGLVLSAYRPSAETAASNARLSQAYELTLLDDTYVDAFRPNQSFGGNTSFYIYGTDGAYALLQFSADAIPPGSTIASVTLTLAFTRSAMLEG